MVKGAFSAWWDEDQLGKHSCWMSAAVTSSGISWEYQQLPEEQHPLEAGVQTWEEFLEKGVSPFFTTPAREVDELLGNVKADILARLEEAAEEGDAAARQLLERARSGVWPKKEPAPAVGPGVLAAAERSEKDEARLAGFRAAAAGGDSEAQCRLGVALAEAGAVAQDEVEAVQWFRRAAEQGHAPAQCNLGICYLTGSGVARNAVEAVTWFRKAAEAGLPQAEYNLGVMFDDGTGVEQSSSEAERWFKKAAAQGDELARRSLQLRSEPTKLYRCPSCLSTDVEDGGVYEISSYRCRTCGNEDMVSIVYPERDWRNPGYRG
jgi:hypothetical protein